MPAAWPFEVLTFALLVTFSMVAPSAATARAATVSVPFISPATVRFDSTGHLGKNGNGGGNGLAVAVEGPAEFAEGGGERDDGSKVVLAVGLHVRKFLGGAYCRPVCGGNGYETARQHGEDHNDAEDCRKCFTH